jgi:site-specific DNA recombinase
MTCAIYARKSTEQNGVADEQKSVSRQIEHARQYATRKGWLLADDHVYVDDGISGAEFANRPGFLRLMKRLGREAIETAYALKQLVQAGVRVFFYLEDRERTLDSPTDKIMLSLTTFADELEREKARQRTYDAMQRKAKAGHVTGGRVFGYDNVDVLGAGGSRSHVMRRINDAEAVVVRRIFELCAAGEGLTRITKTLNEDRVPAPRPQQQRPVGWAGSTVREVLPRPLYRGEIVWNQTRKRDGWGQANRRTRAEGDGCASRRPSFGSSPKTYGTPHRPVSRNGRSSTSGPAAAGARTSNPRTCSQVSRGAERAAAVCRSPRGSTGASVCGSTAASPFGSVARVFARTT